MSVHRVTIHIPATYESKSRITVLITVKYKSTNNDLHSFSLCLKVESGLGPGSCLNLNSSQKWKSSWSSSLETIASLYRSSVRQRDKKLSMLIFLSDKVTIFFFIYLLYCSLEDSLDIFRKIFV
jgi:hypothetical protein